MIYIFKILNNNLVFILNMKYQINLDQIKNLIYVHF